MTRPTDATCAPNPRISQRADVGLAARRARSLLALGSLLTLAACDLTNPGIAPPEGVISYPVAVAMSSEVRPRFLFVANSNFDLRYNAGSVQTYALDQLDPLLERCRTVESTADLRDGTAITVEDGTLGAGSLDAGASGGGDAGTSGPIALPPDYAATSTFGNARGILCDGRDPYTGAEGMQAAACCIESASELARYRVDSLAIDSFATAMAASPDGRHLYVPVSSRSILLDLDVAPDGRLLCGDDSGRCRRGPGFRRDDDDPDQSFPLQPSVLTVGKLADLGIREGAGLVGKTPATNFVAAAHELGGISLFVERPDGRLALESVLARAIPRGNLTIVRPTSIVTSPAERLLYVSTANQSLISRFGVRVDPDPVEGEPDGARELLYASGLVGVSGLASAIDVRDLAFDPDDARRFYALIRGTQESVAILERDPGSLNNARLVDAVRVGAGPSKLLLIRMDDRPFLLVSAYDARTIFVIDPRERALIAMVRNLSGPFQMVFDGARKLLHVADFRASVLRVVDLAWLSDRTLAPPRIIATLGSPRFEGGLE